MAWEKILRQTDAQAEVEAADPLTLAGDVTIVGAGKSLELINLKYETRTTKTVATGAITRDQIWHAVGGEGAAPDNLDTIAGGADGLLLVLEALDPTGEVITVRHNQSPAGTNNILLANGDNYALNHIAKQLVLKYDAAKDTNGAWIEVSRGTGATASLTSSAPAAVDGSAAAAGSGAEAARNDHVHALGPLVANIDAAQNQIKNQVIEQLGSAPGTPVQGQIYYNTADDEMYIWVV